MRGSISGRQPLPPPVATDLDAELDRIAAMNVDELPNLWLEKRGQEPRAALSKDLIARALAHCRQEEHLGGLGPHLRKLLASILGKGTVPTRHLKIGSVIVWEYRGKMHEVLVVRPSQTWGSQPSHGKASALIA